MAAIYRNKPQLAQQVMFQMFSAEQGDATLGFLDEKNSVYQNMRLFNTVPQSFVPDVPCSQMTVACVAGFGLIQVMVSAIRVFVVHPPA